VFESTTPQEPKSTRTEPSQVRPVNGIAANGHQGTPRTPSNGGRACGGSSIFSGMKSAKPQLPAGASSPGLALVGGAPGCPGAAGTYSPPERLSVAAARGPGQRPGRPVGRIILNRTQSTAWVASEPSKPGPVDCLGRRRMIWRCRPCKKYHVKEAGCKKLSCRTCYDEVRSRRARSVFDRLRPIRAPWGIVVLTVPEELRSRAQGKQLDDLRRDARTMLASWFRWCAGIRSDAKDFDVGMGEWTHPVGDKDDVWKPHFNFIVPLLAVCQDRDDLHEIPSWRSERELGVLRRLWRRVLSKRLDATINCEVDVWYEYRKAKKKQHHAAKYFARPFPEWGPADVNKTRWYGWIRNQGWTGTFGWLGSVGYVRKHNMEERNEAPECPDCGELMEFIEMVDSPEEAAEFMAAIRSRAGPRAGPVAA